MKKLIFSSIALIVFSNVSMANTIEVKSISIYDKTLELDEMGNPAAIEKTCADLTASTLSECGACDNLSPTNYAKLFRTMVDACVYSLTSIG